MFLWKYNKPPVQIPRVPNKDCRARWSHLCLSLTCKSACKKLACVACPFPVSDGKSGSSWKKVIDYLSVTDYFGNKKTTLWLTAII